MHDRPWRRDRDELPTLGCVRAQAGHAAAAAGGRHEFEFGFEFEFDENAATPVRDTITEWLG
jgi:hypothetical protein